MIFAVAPGKVAKLKSGNNVIYFRSFIFICHDDGNEKNINRLRLRPLEGESSERHVSWLELFFDLVFVHAVSRTASAFRHHLDLPGALQFTAAFAFIWWAWVGYTFYANRFESNETVYRLLTFAAMPAIVFLALNVGKMTASESHYLFVASYPAVRGILIFLYARAAYHIPLAREFCLRSFPQSLK